MASTTVTSGRQSETMFLLGDNVPAGVGVNVEEVPVVNKRRCTRRRCLVWGGGLSVGFGAVVALAIFVIIPNAAKVRACVHGKGLRVWCAYVCVGVGTWKRLANLSASKSHTHTLRPHHTVTVALSMLQYTPQPEPSQGEPPGEVIPPRSETINSTSITVSWFAPPPGSAQILR
jgi:hypothetical protein